MSLSDPQPLSCSIPQAQIQNGGPGKDGIPALTNPTFVGPEDPGTEYLRDDDRVVGLVLEGQALAIPLNIFWWHEIVNLDTGAGGLAITHCPLTGSSLGFDRANAGGAEFGVSGLLYRNNLIMYDRSASESLWPQMLRGARCGSKDGTELDMVPVLESTWAGWRLLHPDTRVVSSHTGVARDYTQYPYGTYDQIDNSTLLFPIAIDRRRPPKERVLGVPSGTGGVVFPFGLLDEGGSAAVATAVVDGGEVIVFWDRTLQAAMAYWAKLDGAPLSFTVVQGQITDEQTGSTWRVDGLATAGDFAGRALEPVAEAFVAFWFAWPAFYPDIEIWDGR